MSDKMRATLRHCGWTLVALLLPGLMQLAQAQAQATTPAKAASEVQQRPSALTPEGAKTAMLRGESVKYECVYVHPKGQPLTFSGLCPDKGSEEASKGRTLTPENGDIVVVLKAPLYFAALKAMNNKPPQLSLNGVSMAGSARLSGTWPSGDLVKLNFSVTQVNAADARAFWSTAYQRVGFGQLTPMYVAVGWADNPNYFLPDGIDGTPDGLYITSRPRLAFAILLGLLIVGGFVWALKGSDIFRIGPELNTGQRQAYSFARVQWGLWTTFCLASAVFLWMVYGVFLPLSEQMLFLAGVSTLAATTSFFMDASNLSAPVKSTNLWQDLLSGSKDTTAQAHRFQALAVNVVLLVATAYYVVKHLGYPEFDATWLAMLGLSNAAQLAGKQALETQGGTAAPVDNLPAATVPGGPPSGAVPSTSQQRQQQQRLPPTAMPHGPATGWQYTLQQAPPLAFLPDGPGAGIRPAAPEGLPPGPP